MNGGRALGLHKDAIATQQVFKMTKVFHSGVTPKTAIIGSYVPRQCGIATFTADLANSINMHALHDCLVVAVSDRCGDYAYPEEVAFEIDQNDPQSYRACAKFLKSSGIEAICVQHEYGIYGGDAGSYLFDLLDNVNIPVVATLHTILESPSEAQRKSMDRLVKRCSKVVVMSARGAEMLHRIHGVPRSKIEHIHHGVPSIRPGSGLKWREKLGLGNRKTLLTFGLLSPDKGIENAIKAMPEIVAQSPDAVYVVVGATHPHVRANHGEVYRESLEKLVDDLGIRDHVIFHNRFVSLCELTAFLDMADIYVTPYLKREQIASGTLAYALGSGRAIISTPYWYAEELLADGRGVLVPERDSGAIAQAACELLTNENRIGEVRKRAMVLGQTMRWPEIGALYSNALAEAAAGIHRINLAPARSLALPVSVVSDPISLHHLSILTDDTGIIQHAIGTFPNYEEGYCVDDNCRALLLMARLRQSELAYDRVQLDRLEAKYLAFVFHAFNPVNGRFRNFMSYDRRWLEDAGSEDSHARTIWCLAAMARSRPGGIRANRAEELLIAALPVVRDFTSPRAWAYTLLGIGEAVRGGLDNPFVEDLGQELSSRLTDQLSKYSSPEWPWFERYLSYDNARLPEALIVSAQWLENSEMLETGLNSLSWLSHMQIDQDGLFEPIGCSHVMRCTDAKPIFDQQPIEAYASASAYLRAWRITRNPTWLGDARRAASWFQGNNVHGRAVFDPETGGCFDGLTETGFNENQGAESTLAGLLTFVEMAGEATNIGRTTIVQNPNQPAIRV